MISVQVARGETERIGDGRNVDACRERSGQRWFLQKHADGTVLSLGCANLDVSVIVKIGDDDAGRLARQFISGRREETARCQRILQPNHGIKQGPVPGIAIGGIAFFDLERVRRPAEDRVHRAVAVQVGARHGVEGRVVGVPLIEVDTAAMDRGAVACTSRVCSWL